MYLYLAVFRLNYPYLGIFSLNCPDLTISTLIWPQDVSEQLDDITTSFSLDPNTADVNDTSSDATDSDIDTTINCGKYWCSYGGGKSDQDKSHDGLFTCHGAQTDVGNREFLHEYNAVCGKTGVKHHCRTTLNLKSR